VPNVSAKSDDPRLGYQSSLFDHFKYKLTTLSPRHRRSQESAPSGQELKTIFGKGLGITGQFVAVCMLNVTHL